MVEKRNNGRRVGLSLFFISMLAIGFLVVPPVEKAYAIELIAQHVGVFNTSSTTSAAVCVDVEEKCYHIGLANMTIVGYDGVLIADQVGGGNSLHAKPGQRLAYASNMIFSSHVSSTYDILEGRNADTGAQQELLNRPASGFCAVDTSFTTQPVVFGGFLYVGKDGGDVGDANCPDQTGLEVISTSGVSLSNFTTGNVPGEQFMYLDVEGPLLYGYTSSDDIVTINPTTQGYSRCSISTVTGGGFDVSDGFAYVNRGNSMYKVNVSTCAVVDSVATGTAPYGVFVNDNTNVVYTAVNSGPTIKVYDTATLTEIAQFTIGTAPYNVVGSVSRGLVFGISYNTGTGVGTDAIWQDAPPEVDEQACFDVDDDGLVDDCFVDVNGDGIPDFDYTLVPYAAANATEALPAFGAVFGLNADASNLIGAIVIHALVVFGIAGSFVLKTHVNPPFFVWAFLMVLGGGLSAALGVMPLLYFFIEIAAIVGGVASLVKTGVIGG